MKLYTAPFCPKCEVAKDAQQKSNIAYELVTDTSIALAAGIRTVPTLVTNTGELLGLPGILAMCRKEGAVHD